MESHFFSHGQVKPENNSQTEGMLVKRRACWLSGHLSSKGMQWSMFTTDITGHKSKMKCGMMINVELSFFESVPQLLGMTPLN